MAEAQAIHSRVRALLEDAALTVTGWAQCGLVCWDETLPVVLIEINGRPVREVISFFRIYVEV